jgi:hypothetical protein
MQLPKPPPNYRIGDPLTTHSYVSSAFLGQWREVSPHMEQQTIFPDNTVPLFVAKPAAALEFHGWDETDRTVLHVPPPVAEEECPADD